MRKTLSYYKPYIPMILLIFAALFGQAMCELALPEYMSNIINNGIVLMDMDYIYATGLKMVGIAIATVVFAVMATFIAARVAASTSRDIRKSLFHNVTAFSTSDANIFSTASLITRSTNDVQMVQQASVMIMRMGFFAPVMGIGALIKALRTSPSLTWTIGLALACILCLMVVAFVAVMPKFKVLQEKLDRVNQVVGERLSGLLVVRAFNSEAIEQERFDKTNQELRDINIFVNRCMAVLMPAMNIIMSLGSVLIVWVGAHMVEAGNLMIGDMLAFMQYTMHVIMSFLFITLIFIMIPRAVVSSGRIGAVLDTAPSIRDPEEPVSLKGESRATKGQVVFHHVDFAYPDAEEKTLTDIDFVAQPGKTTAIIGGTGAGKSSLINLIPRFFEVTGGSITLDGVDIRSLTQKELREEIGFVPQKGMLFSGTIASNLRYGREEATEEELLKAAATAQALDFIQEMPLGMETPVAQGGTSVSGGQKQRLSIARALLRDPSILIFDDSFSALDFQTDAKLRKALKEEAAHKTIFIVAQRINTIMDADQILVLDEGRLVGKGTHRELLNSCSVYREIATSQLSDEELGREGIQ